MRIRSFLAGVAIAGLTAVSAQAAPAQEGQYGDALKRMLTAAAGGECPADLMGDNLRAACQQQIVNIALMLSQKGDVQSVAFVSAQDTPNGRVETHTVTFANGETMTWSIGGLKNGKFESAGTAG